MADPSVRIAELEAEVSRLRSIIESLTARCAEQSDLLSRKAEKRPAWQCKGCGGMSWRRVYSGPRCGTQCADCEKTGWGPT